MKKQFLTAFLSLLVAVASILGLFVIHYRDRLFKEERPNYYYTLYEDLPAIKASDAAYLLNTEFLITSENFTDCAEDYFSAPGVLYFMSTSDYTYAIKDCEKASNFGEIFCNVSLTAIQENDYPDYKHYREIYQFYNAIGCIELRSWQENTYLSFSRENATGHDWALFRADVDLISECKLIADSLKADSIEVPLFEPPH